MKITIVRPSHGHKAYEIAANTFASLAEEVSGVDCVNVTDSEYAAQAAGGDLTVLIGSDAVNNLTAELYLKGSLESLGIRYCTDDYCIRSLADGEKRYLMLAEMNYQ